MWKFSACAIGIAGLAACASNQSPAVNAAAQHPAQQPPLRSGIDLQYVDSSVRPQDDAYQYLRQPNDSSEGRNANRRVAARLR